MDKNIGTGWEREKRLHFDDIVEDYDKIRWDYPIELINDIVNYSNLKDSKNAIEIGPGTGKATTPFLNAGFNITGIELGKNMVTFLKRKFGSNKNFFIINEAFENVSLSENYYDLIYAASVFHWIDSKIGCPKVFKLLKNNGTFALFRNNAKLEKGKLFDEIQTVYDKYYYKSHKRFNGITKNDLNENSGILSGFGFEDMKLYGFKDIFKKLYDSIQIYNANEYIALLNTYSDHRILPDDDRELLYYGIEKKNIKAWWKNKIK